MQNGLPFLHTWKSQWKCNVHSGACGQQSSSQGGGFSVAEVQMQIQWTQQRIVVWLATRAWWWKHTCSHQSQTAWLRRSVQVQKRSLGMEMEMTRFRQTDRQKKSRGRDVETDGDDELKCEDTHSAYETQQHVTQLLPTWKKLERTKTNGNR